MHISSVRPVRLRAATIRFPHCKQRVTRSITDLQGQPFAEILARNLGSVAAFQFFFGGSFNFFWRKLNGRRYRAGHAHLRPDGRSYTCGRAGCAGTSWAIFEGQIGQHASACRRRCEVSSRRPNFADTACLIRIARFALVSAGFAKPSQRAWREKHGCQCGAGMPCECVDADGLEEPDISQFLELPTAKH